MASVKVESTWEKYGTFLNPFHPIVKWLIQRLEWIKDWTDLKWLSYFIKNISFLFLWHINLLGHLMSNQVKKEENEKVCYVGIYL